MNIKKIISEMTLQEKITFCTGADFWHTKELPRQGIPAIKMSDGPHGLRCQEGEADMIGINKSLPATCFPAAVTAGAAWNRELYAAEGEAIGKEALAQEFRWYWDPAAISSATPWAAGILSTSRRTLISRAKWQLLLSGASRAPARLPA